MIPMRLIEDSSPNELRKKPVFKTKVGNRIFVSWSIASMKINAIIFYLVVVSMASAAASGNS